MSRLLSGLLPAACALGVVLSAGQQVPAFFPLEEVRPGMVGVGRTVFSGDAQEEFRANIVGVLRNVLGPSRNLVLARLEGGPLASTGVIQGMSGSPVYIDGRLLGAVAYSLGSFPKEPFAGITPIGEMTDAVDRPLPEPRRSPTGGAAGPDTIDDVFARLARLAEAAVAPIGVRLPQASVSGSPALSGLAPALRPIGAAMVVSGLDPSVRARLEATMPAAAIRDSRQAAGNGRADEPALRPGDPVGMSLVRGDLELGATGTVTHVDGARVYAFGHPFLNLGTTSLAMTKAHIYAVLPSLDTSMKIAGLGPVIGTMSQDRATGVGGTLGPGPTELEIAITLTTAHAPPRQFSFAVLHDEGLTPLFAYVTIFNTLLGYERGMGTLSIAARGSVDYGPHGRIEIDDLFTGQMAVLEAAAATTASMGPAISNRFGAVMPLKLTLALDVSEDVELATVERAWLDTTRPRPGGTHQLHVLLRRYRGGTVTVTLPVTMPAQANGPLKLVVGGASAVAPIERDLRPADPASWAALFRQLSERRQNNRLYVRLVETSAGTTISGHTLPALPPSVRSVLETDPTASSSAVSRAIVGAWERRVDAAVSGAHELTITLTPAR